MTVLALVSAEGHRTIEALNRELQAKVEKIAEQQRRILALQSQLTSSTRSRGPASAMTSRAATSRPPVTDHAPRPPGGIVGSSPQVRQLLHLVRKVAASRRRC